MSKKKNQEVKTEKPSAGGKEEELKENIGTAPESTDDPGADEEGKGSGQENPAEEASPEDEAKDSTPEETKDPRDEKIEELNDKNLRLMAEFENFRKRSDKEKDQMFETGAKSVIEKVLPVIDNFERALDMAPGSGESEESTDPFMDGMKKVYKQLMDELEKIGVKPIEAVGQEFNPEYHNAVMQVDSEEYDSGIIAQELQKGYMYNDSVVRHSMVGVAK